VLHHEYPPNFPLRVAPTGFLPEQLFLTDWDRWKAPRKSLTPPARKAAAPGNRNGHSGFDPAGSNLRATGGGGVLTQKTFIKSQISHKPFTPCVINLCPAVLNVII